jgi:biotin operon repressor
VLRRRNASAYEIKRWLKIFRPQIEKAIAKCKKAGIPTSELDARFERLATEWELAEEATSAPPANVTTAASVNPFKTGTAGRPTAAHYIRTEAERRLKSGEAAPKQSSLEKFSEDLAAWWDKERQRFSPAGPTMKAGSIRNSIRDLWHRALGSTV